MLQKLFTLLFACSLSIGASAQADLAINPVITSPTSACYMTNWETITCTIVNTSAFPYAGTIEIAYILDGNTAVIESQAIGFMPASGTFIYSFPTPDDFTTCDTHFLKIWVYDVSDPNNLNDTINTYVLSDCDPIAGTITGPGTVCIGANWGEYTLNGSFGNVSSWATSTDGASTWNWAAVTDTFYTFLNVADVTIVQTVVESPFGLCPNDTTNWYTLFIDSLSDAGILPTDFDICDNGNNGTIQSTGYLGTPIDWNLSTNGGLGWIPLSTPFDTIAYNNLVATTNYQFIVQNGVCPPDTSAMLTLTLVPGTMSGTISGPAVVCNWTNNDSLVATGGNGQVINWYVSVDSGLTWQPTTQPMDSVFNFSGLQTDTWLAAEWQLGTCPSETEVYGITVLPVVSSITPDTTINEGDAIILDVCCGIQYLWWPDQFMDDPTSSTPIVDPDADISYFVQIVDINGCIDTARVNVTVLPDLTTLIIPNLFTPNSDGYNDLWEIGNIQAFVANELTIFNVYGQVVYDIAPYNNEWGGTYNGNPLPDGTYFYVLRLNDILYPEPIQGVITITGND
jgi:gliding motility-associated-like protein